MSFLKIDNLSVNYRMRKETVNAVKNINFDVKKGEILGLVGESGSGKSTLGSAIINLIDEPGKISNGKVVLDGINIHENLKDIQKYRGKKIGLIFQDPQTSLNPLLTIGEQLIETIQTHLSFDFKNLKFSFTVKVLSSFLFAEFLIKAVDIINKKMNTAKEIFFITFLHISQFQLNFFEG